MTDRQPVHSLITFMQVQAGVHTDASDLATVLKPVFSMRSIWILKPASRLSMISAPLVRACVKACPRNIIELREKGKKDRRIYVCCVNKEKGGPAKKNCSVACIGCGKCVEACAFEAITMVNNLAYIDFEKCKLCRKCAPVCPTDAIHEINFPPREREGY